MPLPFRLPIKWKKLSNRSVVSLWHCRAYAVLQPPRRTLISHLLDTAPPAEGSLNIAVSGFVRSVRKQKHVAFASLGDGSTIEHLQVVLSPDQAKLLNTGSAVVVSGKWIPCPGSRKQAYELVAEEVEVQGQNDSTNYPIQKKYHTPEFLRNLPHLRVRCPQNAAVLQLRSQIIADTTKFFAEKGYVQTHPPLITSSDCEGAGEVFAIESNNTTRCPDSTSADHDGFFGARKYLTVSTQLHLEALAQAVGKVWTLSPTFRAERSDTSRHLSEFYMLEAELAFAHDLSEIMDVVEELLRHLTYSLRQSRVGRDLIKDGGMESFGSSEQLSKRWNSLSEGPWPRVTYREICSRLEEEVSKQRIEFDFMPTDASGLQTEHERFIAEKLYGGPVFVTDYPRASKPFYMAPSNTVATSDDFAPTVSCFDLLLPQVCEVVGGSMREHRLEPLEKAMLEQGMIEENPAARVSRADESETETLSEVNRRTFNLDWYLDLRRYGSVPHGGFGLGFDRLLGFLAGIDNIKDVVAFPRYYKRCLA